MSTNREGGSCARKLAAFSLVLEFQTHSQSNDHQQLLRRSIRVYGTIMAGPRDRERAGPGLSRLRPPTTFSDER